MLGVLKITMDGEKDITVTLRESRIFPSFVHASVLDELSTYLRKPDGFHSVKIMGELLTAFMAHPKAVEKLFDDLMLLPNLRDFEISFPRTLPSSVEPGMARLLSKYTQQIMSNGPTVVKIQNYGDNIPVIILSGPNSIELSFDFHRRHNNNDADALEESSKVQFFDRVVQETFSFTSSASASTRCLWHYPDASNEAFSKMIQCCSVSDLWLTSSDIVLIRVLHAKKFPQEHIDILKNAFSSSRKRKQQHTTTAAAAGAVTPSRASSSCQSNVSVLRLKYTVFDEPRFASMCQVLQDSTNLVELEIDGVMLSSCNIDASTIWQHILGILQYNKVLRRMIVHSILSSIDIRPLHPLLVLQGKQADDAKSSLIDVLEHHNDSLIYLDLDRSMGLNLDNNNNNERLIGDLLDLNRYGLKAFRTSTGRGTDKGAFLQALVQAVEVAEQDSTRPSCVPHRSCLSCFVNLFRSNPMLVDFLSDMAVL